MTGTVKWFSDSRGYGFICGEDGVEYFLHYQEIMMNGHKTVEAHQQVEFTPDANAKGPRAREVKPV